MTESTQAGTCPECKGQTIQFRGEHLDTYFRICPHYKQPGHLSEDEIKAKLAQFRKAVRPSGRFA